MAANLSVPAVWSRVSSDSPWGRVRRDSSDEMHRCWAIQAFFDDPAVLDGNCISGFQTTIPLSFNNASSRGNLDQISINGNHSSKNRLISLEEVSEFKQSRHGAGGSVQ